MSGDALAAAGISQLLGRGRLDRDLTGVTSHACRQLVDHRRDVRTEFGLFGADGDVAVDQAVAVVIEQRHNVLEQQAAVDALVARVGVRKMVADITQRCGTQQGVAQGMYSDIGVAVSQQAAVPLDVHATQPQGPALDKPVNVKSQSHACHDGVKISCRRRGP